MNRYYFHLSERGNVTSDLEGRDFASLVDARRAAVVDARALMHHSIAMGYLDMGCHIDIEGHQGTVLLAVPFNLAIEIKGLA